MGRYLPVHKMIKLERETGERTRSGRCNCAPCTRKLNHSADRIHSQFRFLEPFDLLDMVVSRARAASLPKGERWVTHLEVTRPV